MSVTPQHCFSCITTTKRTSSPAWGYRAVTVHGWAGFWNHFHGPATSQWKQAVVMSDDVAMTTGRLSVQPGFSIFRHAAGSTQTIWVFNLLNGIKQAAVSDGNMKGWEWGVKLKCACMLGAGLQSQASVKFLFQKAYMINEKGRCYFLFFYHPNPAMANYRDMRRTNKQINT